MVIFEELRQIVERVLMGTIILARDLAIIPKHFEYT
jgi:hypothetical protein